MEEYDEYGVPLCNSKCAFQIQEVEKAEDYIIEDERLCTFIDDDECRATFVYGYHNSTGRLQVSSSGLTIQTSSQVQKFSGMKLLKFKGK